MITFDEAAVLVAGIAGPLGRESVALADARGRVLAEPVLAGRASPSSCVSAMDGYAVREADLAVLPVSLPVAGESFAGAGFAAALPAGACLRIFTGAPLPDGADRVIIQEEVRRDGDQALFAHPPVREAASQGDRIRLPGRRSARADGSPPERSTADRGGGGQSWGVGGLPAAEGGHPGHWRRTGRARIA